MAFEGNLQIVPGLVAGGDLSAKQFYFAKVTASDVVTASVAGEPVDGVIQDKPDTAGQAVSVANSGVSKVVASGAIAKGARVQATATGKAVTAAAAASAASKACGAATYDLDNGDAFIMDVDNIGNATTTFNATAGTILDTTTYTGGTAATITDTTTYAVADQDGLTVTINVTDAINGLVATLVTFAGVTTSAASVALQIQNQVAGISATGASGQVVITTDEVGLDVALSITAGTSILVFAAPVAGTGGLANQEGLTALITLTGGPYDSEVQTVTFTATSGFVTELTQIVNQMNAQLNGCSVTASAGQVLITHDGLGSGMDIAFGAGTGGLTFAASTIGTGDAVDASAVTAAEIETLIEGDTTAEVTVSGLIPTITSPTTGPTAELDFISGTLLAKLGLSVETINGAASGTYYAGKALEAASADGDLIAVLLQNGINV